MPRFELASEYKPMGDQPQAIKELVEGINKGFKHQTLLGATGTGKSLGWNDPVFVVEERDDTRTARVVPIGELIDTAFESQSNQLRQDGDTQILDVDSDNLNSDRDNGNVRYYAQSFNPQTCQVDLYPIQSFVRHQTPTVMYHLQTACGRSATLTGDHNLWVLRDGKLTLIETADARPDDYIPLPEKLLVKGSMTNGNIAALDVLSVLADQRLYVDASEAVLAYAETQARGTASQALVASGIAISANYTGLPENWLQLKDDELRPLLATYFDTYQPLEENTATTSDLQLASDLVYALMRLGIQARIHRTNEQVQVITAKSSVEDTTLISGKHLRWTPIASVEVVEYNLPYVYDFCVPGVENFLAGIGGFFVHNTYTIANVVNTLQKPTLVMAHNKTLAAQLYSEFKEFFPRNAVEYFVSYYDYYQPEAYVPRHDLYIEKESDINDEIERLRLAATSALMSRRDVLIVASVSCIYGLGSPKAWAAATVGLKVGQTIRRDSLLRQLVAIQYDRNDTELKAGTFRVRGDTLELQPAYSETAYRITMFGDDIERMVEFDPLTGELLNEFDEIKIFPAKHYIADKDNVQKAVTDIQAELDQRLAELYAEGKLLEAQRLEQRTRYDLEMIREVGHCSGIENYSRHLDQRPAGSPPWTLLDYLPEDYLLVIDESHMSVPQIRGMSGGDRSRKETLVEYGFRLPSALDNRPLSFDEFEERMGQTIYTSATPGPYEAAHQQQVVQQIIRPTGLVDPEISVRPIEGQIDDLLKEVQARIGRGERALVTTLTKKMSEKLADYLTEMGIRVHYLHSEVETIQRIEILRDLRLGVYDVVVGVNLLREGLDLPEVSLVAIIDADKEGFLRSASALIQTIGRAARHVNGKVIMYADKMTDSMRIAIDETERRRAIQIAHNKKHNIQPASIIKQVRDLTDRVKSQIAEDKADAKKAAQEEISPADLSISELDKMIKEIEKAMKDAAKNLEFEKAAALRDQIIELRRTMALRREPIAAGDGIFAESDEM